MTWFLCQDASGLFAAARIALGQGHVAPIDTLANLIDRRIERMVRIGKTHPTQPRCIIVAAAQPLEGAVRYPVGVVVLAGDRIVCDLGRTRVTARRSGQYAGEARNRLGVVLPQPRGVVVPDQRTVGGELHVVEAVPRPVEPFRRGAILKVLQRGIEVRIEVGLTDQRRPVTRDFTQVGRDARRVVGQRNSVRHNPVGERMLTGEHRGARWHAHDVLHVRAAVVDPGGSQGVERRSTSDLPAVDTERVVALLIAGDEEDVAPATRRSARRRGGSVGTAQRSANAAVKERSAK